MKLLTDEHISPKVATEAHAKRPGCPIISIQVWRAGALLGKSDDQLLLAAEEDGWTHVTYDQKTILPLLAEWDRRGRKHCGVVFVDQRTVAPGDIGGLVRGLLHMLENEEGRDWADRVGYLTRGE